MAKFFHVIKRETKSGINLKLIPQKATPPRSWDVIPGLLLAKDIEKAGVGLRFIVYAGLVNAGLGKGPAVKTS